EYTKVANYLLDASPDYLASRSIGAPIYYGNQLATYSFVQDTWRMRPNLALNFGLRYEYTTVPLGMQSQQLNALASVPGLLTFHAPAAFQNAWGPRAGISYAPGKSGNTAIRAGFGIAYDVIFDNIGLNTLPPEFSTTVNTPAGGVNFLANGGITQSEGLGAVNPAQARAKTSGFIPDQQLPYAINWSVGVQHVFARDYTVEARYLGTRGVHLLQQTQLNIQSPVTSTRNIPTFFSTPSPETLASLPFTAGQLRSIGNLIPAYANAGFTNVITSYVPTGWSLYNGLSLQLNRRFANGLQYQAAYTWSHNIDNSTMEVASSFLTPRRASDFGALAAEKADSALDRRQRLALSIIY
ncbi:MAG: TonB-dependent receptor domain-containing protein, partial [bacterium]